MKVGEIRKRLYRIKSSTAISHFSLLERQLLYECLKSQKKFRKQKKRNENTPCSICARCAVCSLSSKDSSSSLQATLNTRKTKKQQAQNVLSANWQDGPSLGANRIVSLITYKVNNCMVTCHSFSIPQDFWQRQGYTRVDHRVTLTDKKANKKSRNGIAP